MNRKPRLMLTMFLAVIFLTAALSMLSGAAFAHGDEAHEPSPPPFTKLPFKPPADAKPPGERNPVLGAAAIGAIVLAGGAGLYVYRGIRKGL